MQRQGRSFGGNVGRPLAVTSDQARGFAYSQARPSRSQLSQGQAGPRLFGRRGTVQGRAQEPLGDQAIAYFVETHGGCARAEDIREFLDLVRQGEYNGTDVVSIVRTAFLGDPEDIQARVYPGIGRTADMQFTPNTLGVRGASRDLNKASLLWAIVERECEGLPELNRIVRGVLEQQLGMNVTPSPPTEFQGSDEERAEMNDAISLFIASHPDCVASGNADAIREEIFELLTLVDVYNLNGIDLYSLVRTLGLEGYLSSLLSRNSRRWRAAGMAFTPATLGVRGSQRDVLKYSLLWAIVEQYCGPELAAITTFVNNVLHHNLFPEGEGVGPQEITGARPGFGEEQLGGPKGPEAMDLQRAAAF